MSEVHNTEAQDQSAMNDESSKDGGIGGFFSKFSDRMGGAADAILDSLKEGVSARLLIIVGLVLWFFGGTATGETTMLLGTAVAKNVYERIRTIVKRVLMITLTFLTMGFGLYLFSFGWSYVTTWDSSILIFFAGLFAAFGIATFFVFLVVIQSLIRLIIGKEKLANIDRSSAEGQRQLAEYNEEQKSLRGAFAKGILWVVMYMFFGMWLEPWLSLKLFFCWNFALFAVLLTKDSSKRGRQGKTTIGDYAEAVLIGSVALFFLIGLGYYWMNGIDKEADGTPARNAVAQICEGAVYVVMMPVNYVRGNKHEATAGDFNGDGFVDDTDNALRLADINDDGKINVNDLSEFSSQYPVVGVDTAKGYPVAVREWKLRRTVGSYNQPVGDVSGDFNVDLYDSAQIARYIAGSGSKPVYQTKGELIPAVAVASDESEQVAQEPPDDEEGYVSIDDRIPQDAVDRSYAIQQQEDAGQPVVPSQTYVPREIPRVVYAQPVQDYFLAGDNPKTIQLGPFPPGKVQVIVDGSIYIDPKIMTNGPFGYAGQQATKDLNNGFSQVLNYGELYRVVQSPQVIGDPQPIRKERIEWAPLYDGVYVAEIDLPSGGPIEIGIREENFGDNAEGFHFQTRY
ncbi:MAG: hypothetical protein WC289_01735 [Patescibacteria group bacterium]|jgi:hypothetical protein